MKGITGFTDKEIFQIAKNIRKDESIVLAAERTERLVRIAQERVNLPIGHVSNRLSVAINTKQMIYDEGYTELDGDYEDWQTNNTELRALIYARNFLQDAC